MVMGELETEIETSRSEAATHLRELADQLDADGAVSMTIGDRTVTLDPTEPVTFKLEGESDYAEGDSHAKQSIEVELVWWRDVDSAEAARLDVEPAEE
jgi:amphi-Trp domain-containing protein